MTLSHSACIIHSAMSIYTNAKPEMSKIRDKNNMRISEPVSPKSANQPTEVEVSLPMLLVIIGAIGLVSFALFNFFTKGGENPLVKQPPATLGEGLVDVSVSTDYLTIEGKEDASYIFVELSDFECPYCQAFSVGFQGETESTAAKIKKRYFDTGIMKRGYAPYIAVASHKPAATNETLGFYCAQEQGKGFAFFDGVFARTGGNGLGIDQKGAERGAIISLAKDIGADEEQFTACYDKRDIVAIDRIQEKIDQEIRTPWGDKFGSQNFGTPAFAVCKLSADNPTTCVGKAYVGAWPYADMEGVIDTFLGEDAPEKN